MVNILHFSAIIIGGLSYFFSDVNSSNGFSNTLLPFITLLSFIYGVIVTVNMLYNLRKKPNSEGKSNDVLFESIKELKAKVPTPEDTTPMAGQAASADNPASLLTQNNHSKMD